MSSSLKIGAVSGLVAGFISGIVFSIFSRIALYVGFHEPYGRQIWPFSIEVNMLLGAIFGVILGVIIRDLIKSL
jgi:hypothetical protein